MAMTQKVLRGQRKKIYKKRRSAAATSIKPIHPIQICPDNQQIESTQTEQDIIHPSSHSAIQPIQNIMTLASENSELGQAASQSSTIKPRCTNSTNNQDNAIKYEAIFEEISCNVTCSISCTA